MVNPRFLCRQHLLGEHNELHKHRPSFVKKHSVTKRIQGNQIEPASMELRHSELVAEMVRRGFNHASPFEQPDISYLPDNEREFKVDRDAALADLVARCPKCREQVNCI